MRVFSSISKGTTGNDNVMRDQGVYEATGLRMGLVTGQAGIRCEVGGFEGFQYIAVLYLAFSIRIYLNDENTSNI